MGIGHQGGEEAGQVVVAGVLAVFLISKQPERRQNEPTPHRSSIAGAWCLPTKP